MAFLKPEDVVRSLPISVGMQVADLGAGTGAFTVPLAKRLGEHGKIYAVDINSELLAAVKAGAAEALLKNVEVIRGDIETSGGTKLADDSIDLVIIANVLFQTDEPAAVVGETKRILKNGGLAFVLDWTASHGGLGPAESRVKTRDAVQKLFLNSGFALYNEGNKIDAGDYHYGFLFKKT